MILIFAGAVFALQGADVITNSPVMSGHPRWIYIGLAMVVGGIAVLFFAYVGRRR